MESQDTCGVRVGFPDIGLVHLLAALVLTARCVLCLETGNGKNADPPPTAVQVADLVRLLTTTHAAERERVFNEIVAHGWPAAEYLTSLLQERRLSMPEEERPPRLGDAWREVTGPLMRQAGRLAREDNKVTEQAQAFLVAVIYYGWNRRSGISRSIMRPSPRLKPLLLECLRHGDATAKAEALTVLARYKGEDPSLTSELMPLLDSDNKVVWRHAVGVLIKANGFDMSGGVRGVRIEYEDRRSRWKKWWSEVDGIKDATARKEVALRIGRNALALKYIAAMTRYMRGDEARRALALEAQAFLPAEARQTLGDLGEDSSEDDFERAALRLEAWRDENAPRLLYLPTEDNLGGSVVLQADEASSKDVAPEDGK